MKNLRERDQGNGLQTGLNTGMLYSSDSTIYSLCVLFPHSLPAMLQVDACYHSYWSPTYLIPTYDDITMNKHSPFCHLVGRRMPRNLLTTWNWKSLTYYFFTETWIKRIGTKLLHSSKRKKLTSSWPQMLQASNGNIEYVIFFLIIYWCVGSFTENDNNMKIYNSV